MPVLSTVWLSMVDILGILRDLRSLMYTVIIYSPWGQNRRIPKITEETTDEF